MILYPTVSHWFYEYIFYCYHVLWLRHWKWYNNDLHPLPLNIWLKILCYLVFLNLLHYIDTSIQFYHCFHQYIFDIVASGRAVANLSQSSKQKQLFPTILTQTYTKQANGFHARFQYSKRHSIDVKRAFTLLTWCTICPKQNYPFLFEVAGLVSSLLLVRSAKS